MSTLILAVIIGAALWAGSLYVHPFGRCRKCKGSGHVRRGPRRVKVCRKCKGLGRVQRLGSRTLHRAIFRVRDGRNAAAKHLEDR